MLRLKTSDYPKAARILASLRVKLKTFFRFTKKLSRITQDLQRRLGVEVVNAAGQKYNAARYMETQNLPKQRAKGNPVMEVLAYVEDSVVFVFNGIFWTPMKRQDVKGIIPVVTVVANGRKHICRNTTLEEALANYEKCNQLFFSFMLTFAGALRPSTAARATCRMSQRDLLAP